MANLSIEYLPLGTLARAPRNPKAHDLKTLQQSLGRFGYVAPVIIDERTGQLVAGHGRIDALTAAKAAGRPAPDRVRVEQDEWLVPVVRGVDFANPREAEAYLLADNQLAIMAGWGDGLGPLLAELREADALLGTGFTDADLAKISGRSETVEVPAPLERADELQAQWGTARGQLWAIGAHRLLCGDAASGSDVQRLMGDEPARLLATDPPYGVKFQGAQYNPRAKEWAPIVGDERQGERLRKWLAMIWRLWLPHLAADLAFYCWTAAKSEQIAAAAAAADAGLHIQSQIIWAKNVFVLGQADYHWAHENCLYGFLKGHQHRWFGGRTQSTVWRVDKLANQLYEHPTQKPVELFAIPLRNHTLAGDVCAEPFAGSGTQLVAAEQLGRRCYAMEIEPKYVAVALERLSMMGLKPERT